MNSMLDKIERLAIEQAVYKAIGADVATNDPDNLRGAVNQHYLDLYEQTGATGFEVRVNGEKVGTYGFSKVKGQKAHAERIVTVTDVDALMADSSDEFAAWLADYMREHLPELAIQYATETGELLDGMAVVEREHPATPDTIRPNGTLRVRPEKVAAALATPCPPRLRGCWKGDGSEQTAQGTLDRARRESC